jgi:phosphoribosyl 1,2-cyclic phosphate phosphodiesterase
MELVFLGTGTSQGVPMIAQPEGLCDLQDARNWRTRSSVHVTVGQTRVQVDAAQELRLQCIRNEISEVDLFILTHGHADHILGMDDLRRFCDRRGGEALPVYSTEEGQERVRAIFPYALGGRPASRGYPAFDVRPMPPVLPVEGGTIRSTLLPHRPIEVLGLIFEEGDRKIAYYTDCSGVPTEAAALARNADVLVLDGLRREPHPSHMTIDQAAATAHQLGARRTFLTHMTASVDHATVNAELPSGVQLAYDGLRLTV